MGGKAWVARWCALIGVVGMALVGLLGCVAAPTAGPSVAQASAVATPDDQEDATAASAASAVLTWKAGLSLQWQHKQFPGKKPTQYQTVLQDERDAVAAYAQSSASMLRQVVHVEPTQLHRLRFSWKVPTLMGKADMTQRATDDSPVRIVLAFEGDRSKLSMKNRLLSELVQAVTGEPLPYATLMYVWSNQAPQGSVIENPRTDRIRKLVMESGVKNLNQWLDYERDIRADFEQVFGEAPGALVDIGIMTDSDNTQSITQAWYGPLLLLSRNP